MSRSLSSGEFTRDDAPKLRNIPVVTADGEEIGHVGDVYYDEDSGRVQCVGVPGDAIGFRNVMVPVSGAMFDGETLRLSYTRDHLRDWGDDAGDELVADRWRSERDYHTSFGDRGDKVAAAGSGASAEAADLSGDLRDRAQQAVTRSEEEVHVGKERIESGRLRLRKWVETKQVEVPVELRKEKVAVKREPLDQPVSRDTIGDDEVEVTFGEERLVVEKQAVAKERVSLCKDVETDRTTVSGDARKERVDVDNDTDRT